jgi:hypothetical protein
MKIINLAKKFVIFCPNCSYGELMKCTEKTCKTTFAKVCILFAGIYLIIDIHCVKGSNHVTFIRLRL